MTGTANTQCINHNMLGDQMHITSKTALLALALITASIGALADEQKNDTGRQQDGGKVYIVSFGGPGGNFFTRQNFNNIAIHCGKYVDQIQLNGSPFGGSGGGDCGGIGLAPGEYINAVDYRSGSYVDNVVFHTNQGRQIGGGGPGGNPGKLTNIRVLTIGGRAGAYVDQLEIEYVQY